MKEKPCRYKAIKTSEKTTDHCFVNKFLSVFVFSPRFGGGGRLKRMGQCSAGGATETSMRISN
jgi:hypothetical protein